MRRVGVPVNEKDVVEISTSSFYGSSNDRRERTKSGHWVQQLEKLEKIESEFRLKPLTELYKPRLRDPCIFRRTFFKQKEAFDFIADSGGKDLHVFSFESFDAGTENAGKRQYTACSYAQFYHYYKQLRKKHHYEVIPEGAPCRLYFDLEYSLEHNTDRNGNAMVETLINVVNCKLRDLYDIVCDRRRIVDLDATTVSKFSRHLIYHLPGAIFSNNLQAGNFVNHVCSEIISVLDENCAETVTEERLGVPDPSRLRELIVKNKDDNDALFCDLGVYTKNRNFRLIHSTKRGRDNPLLVSEHCQYAKMLTKDGKPCPERLFLDSLICNVSMEDGTRLLTCDDGCRLQFKRSGSRTAPPSKAPLDGAGPSPYPEIDAFIRSLVRDVSDDDVIKDGGVNLVGGIRRWTYFDECELLLYDVHTYRYCDNIKRHHRSNNIMLLVDLRRGVYYQKCHDPDCQRANYKSKDYIVPDEILPKHYLNISLLDSDFSDTKQPNFPPVNAVTVETTFADDVTDEELCRVAARIEETIETEYSQSLESAGTAAPTSRALSSNINARSEELNHIGSKLKIAPEESCPLLSEFSMTDSQLLACLDQFEI